MDLVAEINRLRPHYQSQTAADQARRQMLDHFEEFATKQAQVKADAPLTVDAMVDALGCFWNAALGAAQERQSDVAYDLASVMVQGVAAVTERLRNPAEPNTPAAQATLKLWDVQGGFVDGDTLNQLIWAADGSEACRLYIEYLDGDLDLEEFLLVTEVHTTPLPQAGVDERYAPTRYSVETMQPDPRQ